MEVLECRFEDEELVRGDSDLDAAVSWEILDLFLRRTFLGGLRLLSFERPEDDDTEPWGICVRWRLVGIPLAGSHDFD
jgi:hypothetical protein